MALRVGLTGKHCLRSARVSIANRIGISRRCFCTAAQIGHRAERENAAKSLLSQIIEPSTQTSIVELGCIQGVTVTEKGVDVEVSYLGVPGYPLHEQLKGDIADALYSLDWVKEVRIRVENHGRRTRRTPETSKLEVQTTLSGVKHIIAVSSCKGGVGKSTVAVDFAVALARDRGLRVGILDADVYGPSLPLMLEAESNVVRKSRSNPKNILPLKARGIPNLSLLSFGHVNPKAGVQGAGGGEAAVVRGPVVTKVINQMVHCTEWGDLDYLVVDMPPGTGDIQITLSQGMSFTGALIVTTPHRLSVADAAKGVAMFQELQIPTLAVVENMSYFVCDLGTKYYPFGRGGRDALLRGLFGLAPSISSSTAAELSAGSLSTTTITSSTSGTRGSGDADSTPKLPLSSVYERLHRCPLHCLPLSTGIAARSAEDIALGHQLAPAVEAEAGSAIGLGSGLETAAGKGMGRMAMVSGGRAGNADQKKQIAATYSALVTDVLLEIFKLQADTIEVPELKYSRKDGILKMRYFTPSSVRELWVPIEELRVRDPKTGLLVPGAVSPTASSSSSSFSPSVDVSSPSWRDTDIDPLNPMSGRGSGSSGGGGITGGMFIKQLDLKGKYGVAFVWSDGHFADIFTYSALQHIAEEVQSTPTLQEKQQQQQQQQQLQTKEGAKMEARDAGESSDNSIKGSPFGVNVYKRGGSSQQTTACQQTSPAVGEISAVKSNEQKNGQKKSSWWPF